MVLTSQIKRRAQWCLVFGGALIPLVLLTWAAFNQNLGADPAKEIVLELGDWAINFLWASLAITPVSYTHLTLPTTPYV